MPDYLPTQGLIASSYDDVEKFLAPCFNDDECASLIDELAFRYRDSSQFFGDQDFPIMFSGSESDAEDITESVMAYRNAPSFREGIIEARNVLSDAITALKLSRSDSGQVKESAQLINPLEYFENGPRLWRFSYIVNLSEHYGRFIARTDFNQYEPPGIEWRNRQSRGTDFKGHREHFITYLPAEDGQASSFAVFGDLPKRPNAKRMNDATLKAAMRLLADQLFTLHLRGVRTVCNDGKMGREFSCELSALWFYALDEAKDKRITLCETCGQPWISQPRGVPKKHCDRCRKWEYAHRNDRNKPIRRRITADAAGRRSDSHKGNGDTRKEVNKNGK